MIAENRTVQHRAEAYHRGQAVRLSVKSKGDWYGRGDQNRHRSVTGPGGKRGQRRYEEENRREQIRRNSAGKDCCEKLPRPQIITAVLKRPSEDQYHKWNHCTLKAPLEATDYHRQAKRTEYLREQ